VFFYTIRGGARQHAMPGGLDGNKRVPLDFLHS